MIKLYGYYFIKLYDFLYGKIILTYYRIMLYYRAMKKEKKTPDYVSRAIKKYNDKFDIFTIKLPAGTKDRMTAAGFSPSDRVAAIMAALEKKEAAAGITAGDGVNP